MVNEWLTSLCEFLPQVKRAAIVRAGGRGAMAVWPSETTEVSDFIKFVEQARCIETSITQGEPSLSTLSTPMKTTKGVIYAVLCIELPLAQGQIGTVEALVRWAMTWLQVLGKLSSNIPNGAEKACEVIAQANQARSLAHNCSILATSLADELNAAQVLVFLKKKTRFEIQACSRTGQFDRRAEVIQELELYLNEADEETALAIFNTYQTNLQRQSPALFPIVVPLEHHDERVGYIIVLTASGVVLSQSAQVLVDTVAKHVAPLYAQLSFQQQSFLWRTRYLLQEKLKNRYWLAWLGGAVVIAVLSFVPVVHKVSGDVLLEGELQRAIVAPEDGFLLSSSVKAGATINKGDPLASFDDKSILLEIKRWESERQEYQRQFNKELNALNHVQMRIAKTKVAQAEAQLNLHREKLQRVHISSPIEGVVIRGDLSRSIGAPVDKGQVLFEIAPINSHKLVFFASESNIQYIDNGQHGYVVLKAFPSLKIPFTVLTVSSVYQARKSEIVYRVEAKFLEQSDDLRPGMTGVAEIHTRKKSLLWVICHPLVDWLRLAWWAI